MKKVCVYIDGSNFYHSLRENCPQLRKRFSFKRFVTKLVGNRELVRTYYYNCPVPKEHDSDHAERQQKFFDSLRFIPYFEVRYGRLARRPRECAKCHHTSSVLIEKGVDIQIATDMLMGAVRSAYDIAILVSGDGDFQHVVQAVKDLDKHVEIAYFKHSVAQALITAGDVLVPLDEQYISQCLTDTTTNDSTRKKHKR